MTRNFQLHVGDMFASGAPAIGHGVNCHGLMGAGVAKIIRARYSDAMFDGYRTACRTGALRPGMTRVWDRDPDMPLLANIASQDQPGAHAQLDLLDSAIRAALDAVEAAGLDRLAIPRIGCGIGGLEWVDVQRVLETAAADSSVVLEVWALPS